MKFSFAEVLLRDNQPGLQVLKEGVPTAFALALDEVPDFVQAMSESYLQALGPERLPPSIPIHAERLNYTARAGGIELQRSALRELWMLSSFRAVDGSYHCTRCLGSSPPMGQRSDIEHISGCIVGQLAAILRE